MIVTETQILNRALNENYLRENTDVYNEACRILLQAGNIKAKEMLDEAFRKMKNFIEITDVTNVNAYKKAKKEADTAKHMFASILNQLHLIKAKEQDSKLSELDANVLRNTNDIDALRTEQERQNREQERQNREQQRINERVNKQDEKITKLEDDMRQNNINQQIILDRILEAQNKNTDRIDRTEIKVEHLQEEIKTIKQDIASIKSQLSAHVEDKIKSNPNQFAKILEREIPKDSPIYNQQEYDQIMKILDGLENRDMIDQCKNTINESLFKFAPKLVEALIDGYLNEKDFVLKYKYLKQVDSASGLELCKAALNSIGKFNPSSETVGMILDGVKVAGYLALGLYNVIIPNLELGRIRESYVEQSKETEVWFKERLRSRWHDVSYPSYYGDFTPCTLSKIVYEPFTLESILEEYQKFIYDNISGTFKTLNLSEWNNFLQSSVIPKMKDEYKNTPLKEISKRLLVCLAAHKKGQFEEYKFGRQCNAYYAYGKNARKSLAIRTNTNYQEIRKQLHLVSILRVYAIYNMSSFGEHCYNQIVNNQILTLAKVFGQREESRKIFLENFDKRCLVRSRGYCSFRVFYRLETFMREGTMPIATTSNTIETSDIITETVNAATNTFQNHQKQVTTKAKIENNEINPIVEIGGIEGYDIQRSRINSRT